MKLIEKLFNIRNEMDYFQKNATSGKGDSKFSYNYVAGTPILVEWRRLSEKYKVMLEPEFYNGKVERNVIKGREQESYDFTVSTDIKWKFTDIETGEERIINGFGVGKQNDPSKAFGSEMTYCERYFLLKYFQIPTDELDPDAFDKKYSDVKMATVEQVTEITNIMKSKTATVDAAGKKVAWKHYTDGIGSKATKPAELTYDEADKMLVNFKLEA